MGAPHWRPPLSQNKPCPDDARKLSRDRGYGGQFGSVKENARDHMRERRHKAREAYGDRDIDQQQQALALFIEHADKRLLQWQVPKEKGPVSGGLVWQRGCWATPPRTDRSQ